LTAGVSWEGDHVSSQHVYGAFNEQTRSASHIVNPRIDYSIWDGALSAWVSQFSVESAPGGSWWQSSLDAGVESRATRGWFTVQPSVAFQRFHAEGTIVHGVTVSAHPDQVRLTAGYGTYVDYFQFHDGIFGNVFDPGGAQRPQSAAHYVGSMEYRPKHRRPFDLLRITAVRKDMDVDLWGARNGVRVLSCDGIVARGGRTGWELAFLTSDARNSGGPLVGMIPVSARLGVSWDVVRTFNVSIEANYRSGSVAEY